MFTKRHFLYLLLSTLIPILMVLYATMTLMGGDLNIFMGMFVPTIVLLRIGVRSFILPIDGFEPFSGTSCSDSVYFKRLKLIVEFCSLIVAVIIFRVLCTI
jgi:hypothetical protein